MLVVMKSCVSRGNFSSVRRNFNSVRLPNLEESFSGMATRCQGVYRPRVSSPCLCLELTERWLAECRCRHRSKKKESGLENKCAFLKLEIKLKMVFHDDQSGFLRTTGEFRWHRKRQKHDAVPLFLLVVISSLCLMFFHQKFTETSTITGVTPSYSLTFG